MSFNIRYIAWSGEFELVPPGTEKETPLQRYQRLNCEFRELLDDIQTITNDGKGEARIFFAKTHTRRKWSTTKRSM
jgi:hypothetical protein